MAADPLTGQNILAVLANLDGHSIPEDALKAETELRMGRPLTTQRFEDALGFCRDKGWVRARENEWGVYVWYITDTGKNQHRA